MVFIEPINESLTSSADKKQDEPNYEYYNESSVNKYLSNIRILPNAYFSLFGVVRVEIGARTIVQAGKAGDYKLKDNASINVINEIVKPYEKLQIFIWNGKDKQAIQAIFTFSLSEELQTVASYEGARNQLELNQEVSVLEQKTNQDIISSISELTAETEKVKNAVEAQELAVNVAPARVDVDSIVNKLQEVLDGLPTSPNNGDLVDKLQEVINELPSSPNNAEIIRHLANIARIENIVMTDLNRIKLATQGSRANTENVEDQLNQIKQSSQIQETRLRGIDDNTGSVKLHTFNNEQQLREIKEAVENQVVNLDDTKIVNKLQEVLDGLPTSPDNAVVIDKLQEVINALPASPNNADVIVQLQAVIAALPASPNNADVIQELELVIGAINNQGQEIDFGLKAILDETVIDPALPPITKEAIEIIYAALEGLRNGFDLNELENAIEVLKTTLPFLAGLISTELYQKYLDLLFQLEYQHETIPILHSSQETALFPFKVYLNETNTKLLNLKGNKNMLIIVKATGILNPTTPIEPPPILNIQIPPNNVRINYPNFELGELQQVNLPYPALHLGTVSSVIVIDFKNPLHTNKLLRIRAEAENREFIVNSETFYDYHITTNSGQSRRYYINRITRKIVLNPTYKVQESATLDFTNAKTLRRDSNYAQVFLGDIPASKRYIKIIETWNPVYTVSFDYNTIESFTQGSVVKSDARDTLDEPPEIIFPVGVHHIPITKIISMKDVNVVGGRFVLSGEVLDSSGVWHTYIKPDEVIEGGAIGSGQENVIEFGESRNNKILLSTHNLFRLKLQAIGGIQGSVDIITSP